MQDLTAAIERGHTTMAGLLGYQQREILEHFDRRFDDHIEMANHHEILERFQDSLFFPEIKSRQEQISEAFKGTCKWIFNPPCSEGKKGRTWPSFREWLTLGKNVYWISGKPGSGKSTLMKYIINDPQTMHFLEQCEQGSRVISFFFSNTGSELQRSATGLLRSLLYQMTTEWPELVDLVINDHQLFRPSSSGKMLYAWTDQRLLTVLKLFLGQNSATVGLCVLIDGLDEFLGDKEFLLEIVRSFGACPLCKICVSSRPEQVFREEFARFPRIRVQDLNFGDIKHMVFTKLKPTLEQQFPGDSNIGHLTTALIEKAEGIFLWLSLMINDLVKGSKNGDTVGELKTRLDMAPDTINGMYAYMLGQLDRLYLDDAMKFFATIMAAPDQDTRTWMLGLVCTEDIVWKRIVQSDFAYFKSSEFELLCAKYETRFLARCGGFVETFDEPPDDENQSPVERYQKSVSFIHRSAVEFLEMEYQEDLVQRRLMAAMCLLRANVGILSLSTVSQSLHHVDDPSGSVQIYLPNHSQAIMKDLGTLECITVDWDASTPDARAQADLTTQTLQILWSLCSRANISLFAFSASSRRFEAQLPSYGLLYLAAFLGCRSYLKSAISSRSLSTEQLDDLFRFALAGLHGVPLLCPGNDTHARLLTIQLLLQHDLEPSGKTISSTVGLEDIERRTSFFGLLLLLICDICLLDDATFPGQADSVPVARTVLGETLSLETDLDTRIRHAVTFDDSQWDLGIGPRVAQGSPGATFFFDMSPLSYLQMLPREALPPLSDVEARLSSAGARNRRRFRFLRVGIDYYRVSLSQSQRLDGLFCWDFLGACRHFGRRIIVSEYSLGSYDEAANPKLRSFLQILIEIVAHRQLISLEMMKAEWDFGGTEWVEEAEIHVQEAKHQQHQALLDAVAFGRVVDELPQ